MQANYGLLGHPLVHSFSAAYFKEKFEREGIDAVYLNYDCATIGEAMARLSRVAGLRGFNVTIPYKQAVIPYLSSLSPEARAIGAVNVVRVVADAAAKDSPFAPGFRLEGYNSDCLGFSRSIAPLLDPAKHRAALVLGTGGASRAVTYALTQLGLDWKLVSRTPHDAHMLSYADLTPEVMAAHRVIVNATPLGTFPNIDTFPDIPYDLITPDHLLYDLVYNPAETLFLRKGREHGAVVKNGLEMLHLQAEAAWEIWQQQAS